jgi:hypothetical protein
VSPRRKSAAKAAPKPQAATRSSTLGFARPKRGYFRSEPRGPSLTAGARPCGGGRAAPVGVARLSASSDPGEHKGGSCAFAQAAFCRCSFFRICRQRSLQTSASGRPLKFSPQTTHDHAGINPNPVRDSSVKLPRGEPEELQPPSAARPSRRSIGGFPPSTAWHCSGSTGQARASARSTTCSSATMTSRAGASAFGPRRRRRGVLSGSNCHRCSPRRRGHRFRTVGSAIPKRASSPVPALTRGSFLLARCLPRCHLDREKIAICSLLRSLPGPHASQRRTRRCSLRGGSPASPASPLVG